MFVHACGACGNNTCNTCFVAWEAVSGGKCISCCMNGAVDSSTPLGRIVKATEVVEGADGVQLIIERPHYLSASDSRKCAVRK